MKTIELTDNELRTVHWALEYYQSTSDSKIVIDELEVILRKVWKARSEK